MGRTKRKRKRKCSSKAWLGDNLIKLQKWMKLKDPQLQINTFDIGRGVKCLKKIQAGDELIAVPLSLMMTSQTECNLEVIDKFNELPHLKLTVLLLHESHLSHLSQFHTYLQVLPWHFTNLFFCDHDEIKILPKCLKQQLFQQQTQVNEHYQHLLSIVQNKTCLHCGIQLNKIFDYEKYIWAWFCVNTRAVHYPVSQCCSICHLLHCIMYKMVLLG